MTGPAPKPGGAARGDARVALDPTGSCYLPPLRPQAPSAGRDADVARALAPFLVPRRFHAGEVLWLQGDHAGLLIQLDRGRVKAVRDQADGTATLLYVFTPGDLFGFLPFLDGGVYPATAIALEDVEARVMTRDALRRAVTAQPELSMILFEALGLRLREAFERVSELAQRKATVRVAAALARLVPARTRSPAAIVIIPEPSYTFAEEVGVTPETFSRELKRLEKQGVLHKLGPRRWQVLDPQRLRAAGRGEER